MKIKHFALVKTNMKDADFWIVRKGSLRTVGMVSRLFNPENIGIKIQKCVAVNSTFLYYWVETQYNNGYFRMCCRGTLSLVHITISDVENIEV